AGGAMTDPWRQPTGVEHPQSVLARRRGVEEDHVTFDEILQTDGLTIGEGVIGGQDDMRRLSEESCTIRRARDIRLVDESDVDLPRLQGSGQKILRGLDDLEAHPRVLLAEFVKQHGQDHRRQGWVATDRDRTGQLTVMRPELALELVGLGNL